MATENDHRGNKGIHGDGHKKKMWPFGVCPNCAWAILRLQILKIESLQILGEFYGILEPAFNKDQQYDLFSMYSIYHLFGKRGYVEREGRELVGAAMYKT